MLLKQQIVDRGKLRSPNTNHLFKNMRPSVSEPSRKSPLLTHFSHMTGYCYDTICIIVYKASRWQQEVKRWISDGSSDA